MQRMQHCVLLRVMSWRSRYCCAIQCFLRFLNFSSSRMGRLCHSIEIRNSICTLLQNVGFEVVTAAAELYALFHATDDLFF
jgi:hypothetical protein